MFGNPTEYRKLNGGAHRRRATSFLAPALTWHLAFWISPTNTGGRPGLKSKIDAFVLALCRALTKDTHIKNLLISPCINDSLILFNDVVSNDSFDPVPDSSLSARQKDVKESDYRVVSIKFCWYGVTFTIRVELHTEYFSISTFAELGTLESPDFLELKSKSRSLKAMLNGRSAGNAEALSTYFYEGFWTLLTQRLFRRRALSHYARDPIFDHIFADFRSIILSEDTVPFQFSDRKDGTGTWGREAELKFRSLVTNIERYEYTTSYMLDKRAFYMTALGPQRPEDNDSRRIPLTYLLYVNHHFDDAARIPINKWQLGRLVDRIHLLGTVRLAALKDFSALREAGVSLSQLDPLTRTARDAVTAHRTSGQHSDAITCINEAHDHFNKVTDTFAEVTGSDAGLLYRIERSRYYAEQFQTNIEALRLSRVEGSQRYDEFVQRRLGATFDFIDRLGRRYERAINSLSMLDQNYLAIRANRTGSDVKEIQRYADFALIGALLPYYLIGLISHAMPEPSAHGLIKSLTVILSSGFLAFATFRFFEPEHYGRIRRVGYALIALTLATGLWLGIGLGHDYLKPAAPTHPTAAPAPSRH